MPAGNGSTSTSRNGHLVLALAHVGVVVLVVVAVTLLSVEKEISSEAVVGLLGAAIGASGNAALLARAPYRLNDAGAAAAERTEP